MHRILFTAAMLIGSAGHAEPFEHHYDVSFAGLRVASANVAGDVTDTTYNATARMEARGLAGLVSSDFTASVQGGRSGPSGFAPQAFVQVSGGRDASRLDIAYRDGTPVSIVSTPSRDEDERDIPTLSKQADTVDFLTAVLALTLPGTAEEICSRTFDSFTMTKRVRIEGQGITAGTQSCSVIYQKVHTETLAARDPQPYTLELRPLQGDQFEVSRILGPSEFGRAVITRTN